MREGRIEGWIDNEMKGEARVWKLQGTSDCVYVSYFDFPKGKCIENSLRQLIAYKTGKVVIYCGSYPYVHVYVCCEPRFTIYLLWMNLIKN